MTQKILGNMKKGLAFVLSAPAGSGKNTLLYRMMGEYACIQESVSCTTRPPRDGEIDGIHYYFISKEEFQKKIAADEFLEYAQVFGDHYYGSLREEVVSKTGKGNHVFMVIDVQGAMKIKKSYPEAIFVFISPPSIEELRKRLEARHTEDQDKIERRLREAQTEMEAIKYFDYNIINDDLEVAYAIFKSIVVAEEYKVRKNKH